MKKKSQKIFYSNLGIHAVIIYFILYLSIYIMVFMWIVISIKSGVFEICNNEISII